MPDRQRTLTTTIQWSYDLLSPQAQVLLRRLAVFPATFDTEAAEQVCGGTSGLPSAAVLGALTTLMDTGLIRLVTLPAGVRYRLYQTVREYARERLDESGERKAMAEALGEYMLRLMKDAFDGLSGAERPVWLDRLEPHREDIRFTMEWLLDAGRRDDALGVGSAAWRYWLDRGHVREGYQLLERALGDSVPGNLDAGGCNTWARALNSTALLHHILGGRDAVRDRYEQAAELWKRAGNHRGLAVALMNLGMYERCADRRARRSASVAPSRRGPSLARRGHSPWRSATLTAYASPMRSSPPPVPKTCDSWPVPEPARGERAPVFGLTPVAG